MSNEGFSLFSFQDPKVLPTSKTENEIPNSDSHSAQMKPQNETDHENKKEDKLPELVPILTEDTPDPLDIEPNLFLPFLRFY